MLGYVGFSLVAASGGSSLVSAYQLLVEVASPVAVRASEVAAPQLWSTGLIAVVHGLSCSWHTGGSRTRGQTHVLRIGRQVLLSSSHWGSPPTNLKESQGHEFSEKRQVNSSFHTLLTSNVE